MAVAERGNMERKIISVSPKRQITIPLKLYKRLNLGNEVECYVENGALVIRPVPSDTGEFSLEILKDLVDQGYSGDELVRKFAEQSDNLKKAIGRMLDEADEIASGKRKGASVSDVFGKE
jgi:bifunctional DNA-binding transcriptional regulator/antitoxin component of YhaV-PrlF toxin-antitoxin module